MTLADEIHRATIRLIDSFDGTPEELGVLVHEATYPSIGISEEQIRELANRRHKARIKIMTYDGGRELLELEEKAQIEVDT